MISLFLPAHYHPGAASHVQSWLLTAGTLITQVPVQSRFLSSLNSCVCLIRFNNLEVINWSIPRSLATGAGSLYWPPETALQEGAARSYTSREAPGRRYYNNILSIQDVATGSKVAHLCQPQHVYLSGTAAAARVL